MIPQISQGPTGPLFSGICTLVRLCAQTTSKRAVRPKLSIRSGQATVHCSQLILTRIGQNQPFFFRMPKEEPGRCSVRSPFVWETTMFLILLPLTGYFTSRGSCPGFCAQTLRRKMLRRPPICPSQSSVPRAGWENQDSHLRFSLFSLCILKNSVQWLCRISFIIAVSALFVHGLLSHEGGNSCLSVTGFSPQTAGKERRKPHAVILEHRNHPCWGS